MSLWSFCIAFLSRFRAVSASSPVNIPESIFRILFWAKSRNARPFKFLKDTPGISLRWQPFKFRFLRDDSKPRRALLDNEILLFPPNLRVRRRKVTNALSGTNFILLLVRSSCLSNRNFRNAWTGTDRSSLSAKFRLYKNQISYMFRVFNPKNIKEKFYTWESSKNITSFTIWCQIMLDLPTHPHQIPSDEPWPTYLT